MPRPPRPSSAGVPQHVVQRGNNGTACFLDDNDRGAFLEWLRESAACHGVAVHAYALMGNHVHLLATPVVEGAVPGMMQALGRTYVRYVNRKHGRTGTLWEGRYRAFIVDTERYVLAAYRYIDLNPVRAGLVAEPLAYRWSSHRVNAGMCSDPLLTPHECYLALGTSAPARAARYRALCEEALRTGSDTYPDTYPTPAQEFQGAGRSMSSA